MITLLVVSALLALPAQAIAQDTTYQFPVISGVGGYLHVPNAAVSIDSSRTYRVIIDATTASETPSDPLPGLGIAASILNSLEANRVPKAKSKVAVIVHGDALASVLDNATYKSAHGVDNPNIQLAADLKAAGVELFVCGWQMLDSRISRDQALPDVTVAMDALIVLITYQNDGYALMTDH